mmetsp:Transcript_132180/g.410792  ORF Transcript_132180/g.410792 Transcript_132180/m.410792 type:complete len:214 (+) Transcript_132180:309-950(+)
MNRESQIGASPPCLASVSKVPLPCNQEGAMTLWPCGRCEMLVPGRTCRGGASPEPEWVASRTEGSESASTAMMRRPLFVTAATLLNFCSGCRMPPTKKAEPRTSSRFESTEPSIETCTTRTRPSRRANMQMTTSVMLPKDAFSRPPTVPLVYLETSSVTKETRSAKGTNAKRAKLNVYSSPQANWLAMNANGVKTSNMFILLPKISSPRVCCR